MQEIPNMYKRNGRTIQDYVKYLLSKLYSENKLTVEEINRLHDLEYSKNTFGIYYALLVDNEKDIYDNAGHARYWINYRLGEKYYICSQWWLQQEKEYEKNIYRWVDKILSEENKNSSTKNWNVQVGDTIEDTSEHRTGIVIKIDFKIGQMITSIGTYAYPAAFDCGRLVVLPPPPPILPPISPNPPTSKNVFKVYCVVCGNRLMNMDEEGHAKCFCPSCNSLLDIKVLNHDILQIKLIAKGELKVTK